MPGYIVKLTKTIVKNVYIEAQNETIAESVAFDAQFHKSFQWNGNEHLIYSKPIESSRKEALLLGAFVYPPKIK
jgi:hypothetical protein